MRVLRSLDDLAPSLPAPALTIGNFDGVHRGHQRILQTVVREAKNRRGTAVALTFDPHPARVLKPDATPPLLLTTEQKLKRLEEFGIEVALVLPFTRAFSELSPREFVERAICGSVGASVVCVGETFRFGHRQAGDAALLARLGQELNYTVRVVPPVVVRGHTASSSLIRKLVSVGEVIQAARLLGRPYSLTGAIEPGAGRGKQLDFPTLNMTPEQECLPGRGVYVTEVVLDGVHPAATNIGVRPTFGGERLVVESHLLDFSREFTSGRLEVRLLKRLRSEKKFPSPEALHKQIARDVERTRRYFARHAKPGPKL